MKKNLFTLVAVFAVFASSLFAYDAEKLLKLAQDNTAFYGTDFSGFYQVVQDKPGEGQSLTEAIMYRRDDESKWTILVTGPSSEKGKGYLMYDSNVWFFDPSDRRFTFTSAKDKFQGTNANNSDFAPQKYYDNYTIESHSEVKLGAFNCVLFILKAKTTEVDYPEIHLWVTQDGMVRMKEEYSLSGQKLRTTLIPKYQNVVEGKKVHQIPVNMRIQDNLRGKKIGDKIMYEKTVITISNCNFEKQRDSVYTKPYLETMSQK